MSNTFVLVYCLILLASKLANSKYKEDDKLIYTSIPDMVKSLSAAIRVHEDFEQLRTHYRLKLNDVAETFQQLQAIQVNYNGSILHPIFFIKTILTINRILQTQKSHVKEIENLEDDLLKLTQEKTKAKRLKVDGHIRVLFALQDFYDVDTEQAADGILKDSSINISLSALDCYEIGSWALENKDAYHAKLWLNEAKRRLISKSADQTARLENILLKLANVYSVYKDEKASKECINEVLKIDPTNEAALQFQVILQASGTFYNMISESYKSTKRTFNWGGSSSSRRVQKLCQQEQRSNADLPNGFCYYHDLYTYYHIKIEVISINPVLGILHEIITSREILAFHLQATLQNPVRLGMNHSTVIHSESNQIIQNFKKKISAMAIPITIVDPFMYTHFDIGEFHKLKRKTIKAHRDFGQNKDNEKGFLFMLFLNNVEGGGQVIFPWLNVSMTPQKGNALVWAFEPGKTEESSLHTICPIYAGNCTVVLMRGYSNEY